MLGNLVSLYGLAIALWAFAYTLEFQFPYHPLLAALLAFFGVLAAIMGVALPLWPAFRAKMTAAIDQVTAVNWIGPVNLPTIIASLDVVLFAVLLGGIFMRDAMKQMMEFDTKTEKAITSLTDKMLHALDRYESMRQEEAHGLPISISLGNQAQIADALRKDKTRYKVKVYRELTDHCVALGDQFDNIFAVGKWESLAGPWTPPVGIKIDPGINILSPMTEPPYLGAALLRLQLREVGIQADLKEDPTLKKCQCVVVTIAELKSTSTPTPTATVR
jgi:hypothetical protein